MIFDTKSLLTIAEEAWNLGFEAGKIGAYAKGYREEALGKFLNFVRSKLGLPEVEVKTPEGGH